MHTTHTHTTHTTHTYTTRRVHFASYTSHHVIFLELSKPFLSPPMALSFRIFSPIIAFLALLSHF